MTYLTLLRASRSLAILAVFSVLAGACVVEQTGQDQDELGAESCDNLYSWRACDQDIDPELDGVQVCVEGEEGNEWTECEPHKIAQGPEDCSEDAEWNGSCCMNSLHCCESDPVCMTPLVLSFDHRPVRFGASDARFDLTRAGMSVATDWPAADTPWLALDRNGNGRIDDGGELFGSATQLGSGVFADNGFAALAQLDDNRDGFITEADGVWSQLLVWSDRDANRASGAHELSSVASHGLVAIELDYRIARRCDARGNCEAERARFWFRDDRGEVKSGTVVDVHLAAQ